MGISNATAGIIPDLSKALVILPDKNVINSTTEQKGLKQYWKAGKRPHFSRYQKVGPECLGQDKYKRQRQIKIKKLAVELMVTTSFMLVTIASKSEHKERNGDQERKKK